jgi:hypothetical protein
MTPEQNAHVKSLATREEIFDHVEKHLKSQGCRSLLPDGHITGYCAYRGEEGRMCAVGCLIGDDEYTSALEHLSVVELSPPSPRPVTLPDRLLPHVSMLKALQNFHDNSENWSQNFHDNSVNWSPHKGLSIRGIGRIQELRRLWLTDSK